MSETATAPETKVSAGMVEVNKIIDILRPAVTVGADPLKASVEKGTYGQVLEALGSNLDEASRVNRANLTIAQALLQAGGDKAIEAMGENASIERVSGQWAEGGAEFGFDVKREASIRNVKTGETSVVYGQATASFDLKGSKGSVIKEIKTSLRERAAARFGK